MEHPVHTDGNGASITSPDAARERFAEESDSLLAVAVQMIAPALDAFCVFRAGARRVRVIHINPAFVDLTGYTASEVLGADPIDLFASIPIAEVLRAKPTQDQISKGEAVFLAKNSSEREVQWRLCALPTQPGQASVWVLLLSPKHPCDQIPQETNRQNQEFIFDVLACATDSMMLLDPATEQIVQVNRQWEELLGWSQADALDMPLEILHPGSIQDVREFIQQVSNEGSDSVEYLNAVTKSGLSIPVELSGLVVHLEGQFRILVMVRDITHRKRTEAALRASRRTFRTLAARLQSVREEERAIIAREIHDELGQALTGLKIDLAWLFRQMPPRLHLAQRTQAMLEAVDDTVESVKRISSSLRPPVLDDLGLDAAIEWMATEFQKRTTIHCHLDLAEACRTQTRDADTAVFRIFQEALTNVARHAKADKVWVALGRSEQELHLYVEDNGIGIPESKIHNKNSLGLLGMHERAASLGGTLRIQRGYKSGTRINLEMPLSGEM